MADVVIQEEVTGCGIASVANILGTSYKDMKARANTLGIFADDESLWSDTRYVRTLLNDAGVDVSEFETPFESWNELPDLALLAIKHHEENGRAFWHWVVFKRENGQSAVLDSASYLEENKRLDFNAMTPKWFIEVKVQKK